MEERAGGAEEEGESLTVIGRMLRPGEPAPDFTLDHTNPAIVAVDVNKGNRQVAHVIDRVLRPANL